ncbi:MAG: signal peptidase I, partial [Bacteroidota bacterium]|nr:signal peptidase I [Bacteroidota bacterium]
MIEIIFLLVFLFFPLFLFKTFENTGNSAWKAAVPLYNYYIWLKIVKKPVWWFIFLLIPFINYFMMFLLVVETAKCYQKYKLGDQALAVVFFFYFLPYYGSSEKEKFLDPSERPKIKKSIAREWGDAIIFAVIAASIIRTFLIEAYTIPTSSMEKSLLVGDFLFVSKASYGPRNPNTPISFPFVHHTLPLTESTKSYIDWLPLPYYRFSGFSDVERNDVVVFNFPVGDTVSERFQSNRSYYSLLREYGREVVNTNKKYFGDISYRPVDKRENFIKRCVAIGGDTIQIKDQKVFINGKLEQHPGIKQYKYIVETDGSRFNSYALKKLDITEDVYSISNTEFLLTLTDENVKKVKAFDIVKSIRPVIRPAGVREPYIFPHNTAYNWNVDNFGPLLIPKKGSTIELSMHNLPLYERVIGVYEGNDLKVNNNKIFINGEETSSYTFKMNYYWMMGDNRHNSA